MSPVGPESFQRLEDFPSFISCIKCFGRPIIPPLLTPSRRNELKKLRIAAAAKEIEFMRRRKEPTNQQTQDDHILYYPNSKEFYESGLLSNVQESCALWYPSFKNNQERISVAISKFPTNDIYSSVHSSAIVCSNVIEDSHAFSSRIGRDSILGSQTGGLGSCTECSHNSINLECSLCQVECNRGCSVRISEPDISPEVPCRTFSLLQQGVGDLNDELNSTVEDTEGESLPTIIHNPKYLSPDTDSESNITSMTQSTDLERYMQHSCEFSSPDCSAIVWDSRSVSQPYALSRSDDASSETIVNTENELTPCASTMAELTDNIEDEMSNAEENVALTDNKDKAPGTLRRAHSVDSYMKIIQSCARSLNVKKSLSEPFNTTVDTSPKKEDGAKITISSKTNLLIKEDSKESEESRDIPEKDVSGTEIVESSPEYDRNIGSKTENGDSFEKKHVRQNSYTLEHPSSALILAHADCMCNLDSECVSPHCSALKGGVDITHPSAFTKEKVDVDGDLLRQQMKKLPMFGSQDASCSVTSVEHSTSAVVIDVFPVTEENSLEKSDSRNANVSEETQESEKGLSDKTSCNAGEKEDALCEKLSDELNVCEGKKNPENVKNILDKYKENEIQMERLIKEQKELWLKLQQEYEERNKLPQDQLNRTSASSNDTNSFIKVDEKCEMKNCKEDRCKETSDISAMADKGNTSITSTYSSLLLSPTCIPDVPFIHAPTSPNHCEVVYPSKDLNLPSNVRDSVSPSIESQTPHPSPSKSVDNLEDSHIHEDCHISVGCQNDNDSVHSNVSEALPNVNGYACSFPTCNYLPRTSDSVNLSSNENWDTCFCDKSPDPCECCTSYNGFQNFHISDPVPSSLPRDSICDLGIKNSSNQVDLLQYCQSSSSLGFPSQRMNPRHFSADKSFNPETADLPNKASDSEFASQTSTLKSLEMPSTTTSNKERKYLSPETSRENSKLYVDTSPPKTLKNGSIGHQEKSLNRRLVDEPVLMKKFEKLPAFVKGYLTRRLFKTERVQSLIKTLQDTALLIGKLSEDLSRKGDSVSERDVDFHRQLIVQLMTTFHNVYDIFCTISTKERMSIIAESRNQRHPKMKPESENSVLTEVPDPAFSKKPKLSSATLKALERKRRTPIDSRTYTIEDFKNLRSRSAIDTRTYTIEDLNGLRGRSHSSLSSKNLSVSPTSIYKTSVGLALKRKTANVKSSRTRQNLQHKWVP